MAAKGRDRYRLSKLVGILVLVFQSGKFVDLIGLPGSAVSAAPKGRNILAQGRRSRERIPNTNHRGTEKEGWRHKAGNEKATQK